MFMLSILVQALWKIKFLSVPVLRNNYSVVCSSRTGVRPEIIIRRMLKSLMLVLELHAGMLKPSGNIVGGLFYSILQNYIKCGTNHHYVG